MPRLAATRSTAMTAVESSGSHAGMTRPVCLMQRRVVAASSLRMRWYATVEPMSATHLNEKSDSVYAPGPRGTPNAGELTAIFDTRARCAVCGESFLGSTIVLDEFVAKRSPSRARRRRLAAARAAARAAAACAATRARGASARSLPCGGARSSARVQQERQPKEACGGACVMLRALEF